MRTTPKGGCTATVVLITADEIYCANAGDSRVVMAEHGKAVELSTDHKPTVPAEKERVEKAGGEIRDGRVKGALAMTRAIGDFNLKPAVPPKDADTSWYIDNHPVTAVPEIVVKPLHKDIKFLVLACDGIWDCKTSE